MSTQYTGDPTNFPPTITLPSDGDGPGIVALDVNAGFEGLADAIAALAAGSGLSWFPKQTIGTDNIWALYLPSNVWFVHGAAETTLRSTGADGSDFSSSAELAALLGGHTIEHSDVDASGNIVVSINLPAGTEPKVAEYNGAAWAVRALAAVVTQQASVVYDPVNTKWCVIAYDGAASQWKAYTSPDRVTWTATNTFTGLIAQERCMAVRKSTGKIVAIFESGGTVSPRTSADGGATWASPANFASTIAAASEWSLYFNSVRNEFVFTIGETTGTPTGEVWVSADDGATWTKKKTFANACLTHCTSDVRGGYISLARILEAGAQKNDIVFSLDGGATWQRSGVNPAGNPRGVFHAAAQLICLTDVNIYRSVRVGGAGIGALT
jgi:hypothetical protein